METAQNEAALNSQISQRHSINQMEVNIRAEAMRLAVGLCPGDANTALNAARKIAAFLRGDEQKPE